MAYPSESPLCLASLQQPFSRSTGILAVDAWSPKVSLKTADHHLGGGYRDLGARATVYLTARVLILIAQTGQTRVPKQLEPLTVQLQQSLFFLSWHALGSCCRQGWPPLLYRKTSLILLVTAVAPFAFLFCAVKAKPHFVSLCWGPAVLVSPEEAPCFDNLFSVHLRKTNNHFVSLFWSPFSFQYRKTSPILLAYAVAPFPFLVCHRQRKAPFHLSMLWPDPFSFHEKTRQFVNLVSVPFTENTAPFLFVYAVAPVPFVFDHRKNRLIRPRCGPVASNFTKQVTPLC